MITTLNTLLPRVGRLLAGWAVGMLCVVQPVHADDPAQALRDKYQGLAQQLADNPFHRPVVLDSTETPTLLKGDIYSVVEHPFATVNGTLNDPAQGPANWCDVLILHLNIKYCRASAGEGGGTLDVNLGRKVEQSLSSSYPLRFSYRSAADGAGYFRVELKADSGPFSTKDYRIVLEAIPAAGNRTFLHLTYAYGYGTAGRLAMRTYLATIGADKVGFTNVAGPSAAQPEYVGGVRGLLERNTMRYYLAIDAYLKGLSAAPDQRLQQRLVTWFDATEHYARQLHEIDKPDYLQMKRHEYERQQAAQ
ncbi:putative signal peptide protein (plasmid) [Ralstonia solanacearum Po82]|uniref:Putative signal peptide protein n=2 Tax=Ralstonia solanacearum TaxID=305 RepID=F6GA15_RALS8|nr:putative signal peptide protein [Ralstonia solanacearum Po82]